MSTSVLTQIGFFSGYLIEGTQKFFAYGAIASPNFRLRRSKIRKFQQNVLILNFFEKNLGKRPFTRGVILGGGMVHRSDPPP